MSVPMEVLLVISSVGAIHSAFFGVYLLLLKRGNRLANQILAFLLIAFAVRMIKSVSYYFDPEHNLPAIFENAGFAAHELTAPLLFFYLKAYMNPALKFRKIELLHFIPGFVIVLLSPFIKSEFWLHQHGYEMLLYFVLAYIPVCFYFLWKNYTKLNGSDRGWLAALLIGIALVWAAYSVNFLLGWVSYITAPVIFSFVMYIMSFFGLRQNGIFTRETRYRNSTLQVEEVRECIDKLMKLMNESKPYTDHDLTLPRLAKMLMVSPHLLSQIMNEHLKKNFSDFINGFRVNEAQRLLLTSEYMDEKISSIAYDAGFNTLSSFNAAFRKHANMTPSEYRKKYSDNKIKA